MKDKSDTFFSLLTAKVTNYDIQINSQMQNGDGGNDEKPACRVTLIEVMCHI